MIDIKYLAGLIDGEGCVTIFRHRVKECLDDIWVYRPIIQIGMTYKPLISLLHLQYGGSISHKRARDISRRPYSVWGVRGNRCIDLLRELEPFLIVKKAEAQLVLQYWSDQEARLSGGTMKGLKGDKREAIKAKREWYRLKLQELKKISFGPLWDADEFGEQPMPGASADGQSRAKPVLVKTGSV